MMNKERKENLFIIAFDIFLVGILLNSTKFNVIEPAIKMIHIIQIVGATLAIIKILLDAFEIFKSKKKLKINYLYLLFFLSTLVIFYITKSKTIVYFDVFLLAAKDVDFNRILRSTLRVLIVTFIFVLSCCFCGLIDDLTVIRVDIVRHSYGWNSPNCLILNVFEIISLYMYLNRRRLNIFRFALCLLFLVLAYYVTNSRMGFLAGILLILIFMLLRYTKFSKLYDIFKYLVYALPTLLTIMFIGLVFAFEKCQLYELDDKLTGRLFYSRNAIDEYKIKPFGTKIDFVGQQLEKEYTEGRVYNYVDNSYLKTLLNYGVIFTLYLLIFLFLLNRHAYKRKDYYLLSIFVVAELYCFFDSWLIGIEFNPYLLLLASYIYPISYKTEKLKIKSTNRKILSISIAAYNLGDMIRQCLDSFANSDVLDYLEIIVTDDGSKDNTPSIVQEYVDKYPNSFKLVKQRNQGPGSTVNSGIKHATGKYFRMVDGDDRVVTSNLKELITYLDNTNVDMVINDYDFLDHKTEKIVKTVNLDIEPYKEYQFEDVCDQFYLEMHNVIYKTDILKSKKITLDNGFYTDVEYLLFPMPYVKTCVYIDKSIYVYRINQANQSVSIKSLQKNIGIHTKRLDDLIKFYKDNKKKLTYNKKNHVLRRIVNFADNGLVILLTFDINDKQIINIKKYNEDLYKKDKDIFELYSKSKKYKLLEKTNYKVINLLHKLLLRKLK